MQIIQLMVLKLFEVVLLRVQGIFYLFMFAAALNVTNYQNILLFGYNLGTVSNAYPILNNRGHYDVMFLVFSIKGSILFHSKNIGFSS